MVRLKVLTKPKELKNILGYPSSGAIVQYYAVFMVTRPRKRKTILPVYRPWPRMGGEGRDTLAFSHQLALLYEVIGQLEISRGQKITGKLFTK